jgi:hypothetical protein
MGVLALFLLAEHVLRADRSDRQQAEIRLMRDLLGNIANRSDPQRRFNRQFERLSHLPWTPRAFAPKAAEMLAANPGMLDLFLFDEAGRRVPLGDTPPAMVTASERFRQALRRPDAGESSRLIEGFAGNPEAARLLASSPGVLVDLLNGERRTYGGWWKLRDRQGRETADLVVFIHRSHCPPTELLTRACVETNARVRPDYRCGWFDPAAASDPLTARLASAGADSIAPGLGEFPAGLVAALRRLPAGIVSRSWKGCAVTLFPGPGGEVLFCLAARPIDPWRFFTRVKASWICSEGAPWAVMGAAGLLLLVVVMASRGVPRFGVRARLLWYFGWSSAVPLAIFVAMVFIDRSDHQTRRLRDIDAVHVQRLTRLDQGLATRFLPLQREYEAFCRHLRRLPLDGLDRMKSSIVARLRPHWGLLTHLIVMDATGRTRLLITPEDSIPESANSLSPQRQERREMSIHSSFARGILLLLNRTPKLPGAEKGNALVDAVVSSVGRNVWFDENGLFRKNQVGQDVFLSYYRLLPAPENTPPSMHGGPPGLHPEIWRGIFFAAHDPFLAQRTYLERIFRSLQRDRPWLARRLYALPVGSGGRAAPFPHPAVIRNHILRDLRDRVLASGLPQHEDARLAGRRVRLTAFRGSNLEDYVLILAQPYSALEREAASRTRSAAGVALAVFLLAAIGAVQTSRMLIPPLRDLERGLQALDERQFTHRVPNSPISDLSLLSDKLNLALATGRDVNLARTLQERLWPGAPLRDPDWEVLGACRCASHIGGDHHDFFRLPDGRLAVVIGDVAGHGIPAGLVMASLKAGLFLLAGPDSEPEGILQHLNRMFRAQTGRLRPMTLWLGFFDFARQQLVYANAGACYPLLAMSKQPLRELSGGGYPMGAGKVLRAPAQTIELSGPFRLLLYTDGFVEALAPASEQAYGYDRLRRRFRDSLDDALPVALSDLFASVAGWSGREIPEDDQTAVLVDWRPDSGKANPDLPCPGLSEASS